MKKYNPITKKWEDTDEVLIDKYGEEIQKALYAKNSMDKYDPEKYEVVKGTNIKKSWFNNWFKTPKAFEDGYDFGDVTKTILGTGGKVATELTKGILNIGEGIGDTINYGISWGADKLGAHEFAENLKEETKKDLFNNYLKPNDEIYGKNSITDTKTDNIVNSLGYMYGLYATAGLGKTAASQTAISTATTFESSYGHALSEAYNAGASDKDARRYALISASAEAGSELMFGGIGKGSKAIGLSKSAIPVDDKMAKFASDRFKSTFAKNLTQWAIKSGGEGLEEVISGTFSALGKKLTYMKDEDFKKILKDEQLLDQFISGAVSAGISSGTGMIKSTKSGQDYISGRTNSEQQIYDRMIENKTNELKASKNNELKQKEIDKKVDEIIAEKKEKFKNHKIDEKSIRAEVEKNIDFDDSTIKLSKKEIAEINEEVDEAFEKGKLNLNDIYETFTPEETNKIERLDNELKKENLSEDVKKRYEKELLETIQQRNKKLTTESEKNIYLKHTLYNEEQRATNFKLTKEEQKLVDKDKKIKDLYDDAVKYGNNSEEAHKFVNALAKMSTQTEYQYRLTDTKELSQLGYGTDNKNAVINGLHDGDNKTIYINMDSDNALNVVVGHETGHIFENTQEYKELQEMLFKVAEEDGTLEARRAELKELYKNVKNADIDVELTNDLLGEKLFTDEKFIERLAQKPNLFTKIKDKIDDLVIQFKGTEEEKELRKIQNKFLEVYRRNDLQEYVAEADAKTKKTKGTELKISKNSKGDYVKADRQVITGKNTLKWESQVENYINETIRNGKDVKILTKNGEILTITADTAGKAKFRNNYIDSNGKKIYMSNEDFYTKLLAEVHIDELAQISKKINKKPIPDKKNHSFAKDGFDYRTAYFEDFDGNYYKITMSIGKNGSINTIYNVGKLEQRKSPVISGSSVKNGANGAFMNNNIPQTQEKIKSDKADYSLGKNKIQGLEDYSKEQIYNLTKDYINTALLYSDIDAEIKGMEIIGSRNRGTAKENSDLDIVVELDGDNLREDDLFNVLNDSEEPLEINGIKVDINPIVNYRSGTLEEFMKRSNQYDQDILKNQKLAPIKTNNLNEYIADVSAREAKQNALDKESVRQSIIDYLEENNITNPTKEDMMNAFDDYDVMDNSDTLNDANKAEKLYSEVADEILKENNSKYSLSTKDNQNRTLSKEQQDYFKDSKVRDENGNLKVLYNGSGNHTTFLPQYMSDESIWGKGIYLTPYKDVAELYGNDIKEVYVDIKNPLTPGKTITFDQYNDLYKAINDGEEAYIEEYNMYDDDLDLLYDITNKGSWADYADEIIKYTGKDGIIIDNPDNEKSDNMVVAFKSNQIKNVDNLNPSKNDDIRYSLSNKDKIAPIRGDYQVYSKDIRNNNLAPIREDMTKKPASKNVNYQIRDNYELTTYDDLDTINRQYDEQQIEDTEVDYSAFDDMIPIKNELERLDSKEEEKIRKKREKYQQQIDQAKRVSKQKKSEFRKNYDNFKTLFINENAEVDNLAKESGNKKLTYKADMLNNYVVEAENDINNYQTDYNGKEIGKSVKQLFEPAKNKGLYEAFNDYLINYSNIDRHKQGKGSLRWESTSQDLINQYEKKYPEFKKWAKDVWQYGKNALNTMEQSGLIDSKLKQRLTEMYPHYVPFMDNADLNMYIGSNDEIVPKSTIKYAKGGMSTTEMLAVEDALTRYAYSYRKSMRQNDLYSEIVKTLKANEIDAGVDVRDEVTNLYDSLYRDENGNYLKAYIDGDTKVVSISNDLYRALQNDLKNQVKDLEDRLSLITKPLQKVTRIKGNLVTSWSPSFIFKNFFKDFQDAMFNSTDTKKFMKNYPSAFRELKNNNTQLVRQFRAMYGSAIGQYTGSDTGAMKQATKTKNPFKKFANANEIIELAPRYAEFKASLENGATIEEAMYNAREVTTNFSRGGTITKAINRNGFNFINASTQGLSKFIRNFTGQNGAKGFTQSLVKAVEFGIAPALFNELIFGSGDDKDEDYDALPDYIKDNYYLFKYGDNKFIRIPKGRALSVFGSGARRTLEYFNGEKDAFDGYGTNVWNQIGINNPEEAFLFTPIKQAKDNKAWYGGDIVPTRLQDKPAAEQYDEKTDLFSKWLGQTLNISPKKINYVIDQYTGGIGDIALPFITPEAQSEYDNPAGRALAPIRDQFVVNSIDDNKYVSDFYTNNDKLKVQSNSEYATDEDTLKYKYSSSVSSELSALYKERRLIQNDTSLSNSEKYKKAQAIKQQINEIAKEGLDNYKKVNVVGNYAEVNDREYYKNNKGEWTKAKEEDIEEMNKFGLTPTEKNNYYNSKNDISNITSKYKSLSEDATEEERTQLSSLKKNEIINTIKATNISNDAKAYLYSKYYSTADKMNVISTLDININKYLDFELQNFTSDKNIYGQTIKNSKKTKMINYINNLDGTYGEKIIIYKLNNMSDDSYNKDIVNYINNQNISMEEKRTLLKALGMKVDYAGNVRW